ncbi:site-specific DNA-methyltransferase [Klebsiella variicola]|uniref:Type III restriction-modification system methylation subunit n=1 Tax=Klebsiella variicola TaxID=244366 RepID=A0A7H4MCG2_KLEVA|nr:DNA methyltransferase [Klebsiella variicola]MBC5101060.1 site-specific DNA-methyltransferase [Klebsiella variicola]QKK56935.1 site-specific DNA-methyltransferase [Klebsiella variicola]STS88012.1 type III restriction-modification system methylation subunit [Klebsiella variicola]HCA9739023.1 site-specific DNA-methyltransferase [Klebsiella variicola subsp. variicola]
MSRLTDLIAKAKAKDPQLAADLDREIKILSSRLPFGLNFERHSPEVVELPLRPIRKGDKVRVLPERGSTKKGDQRLWQVKTIHKAKKVADLELLDAADIETQTVALSNLVVIAEFRDTIWPGMVSTGKVQRGGDKPFHSVINGENYHVLKALTYTHRGKVDAIYIDPPYNTGAKDWKYNNDYVEEQDLYRHSKWLAFMERRLLIAKELLNPANSVLIVTIDEKEYLRLGLLLEQVYPNAKIEMVSSVINPKGTGRSGDFARTNEFLFFVRFGSSTVSGRPDEAAVGAEVAWETMRRRNLASIRGRKGKGACGPNQFYPIFVDEASGAIIGRGDPLNVDVPRESIIPPLGAIAVFPVRSDGTEMNWEYTDSAFDKWWREGYIRANGKKDEPQPYIIQHLPNKARNEIADGIAIVERKRSDGSIIAKYVNATFKHVTTQWDFTSHSAEHGGTGVIKSIIPGRKFPFPKSLYAVEDALRFFIANKPDAIILDFFSGSGTTAHAVMRLNKQDGGRRQCISVTNNEVAASEQKLLREQGLRPGDPEWEKWGICDYITKPRVQAAITGKTPEGESIKGDYKFIDEFPMSEGFEENAEFFTLTYEAEKSVSYNLAYARIAPLLWLRAGARGKRIEKLPAEGWAVADTYGLLSAVDQATPFIEAISHASSVRVAFIVTDDDRHFQAVTRRLPKGVEPVRLYESYLTNFSFTSGELTE